MNHRPKGHTTLRTPEIPDALPELAADSHPAGSGQACIMNAISYLNGDTSITDMPDCTYPPLAALAHQVNDTLCRHRPGRALCPACSHRMWALGARLIGTADAVADWSEAESRRLNVHLAAAAAAHALALVPRAHAHRAMCAAAIRTALAQVGDPATAAEAQAAYDDAAAVEAATSWLDVGTRFAVCACRQVAYAGFEDADRCPTAVESARTAACWAADGDQTALAHAVIDEFEARTGSSVRRTWTGEDASIVRTGAGITA